jgi:hypothetical protein
MKKQAAQKEEKGSGSCRLQSEDSKIASTRRQRIIL